MFLNCTFHYFYSSKSDSPKQQSKKLKKLLRLQEKPKQKGKGGFKLRKSLKEKSNKHKVAKVKGKPFLSQLLCCIKIVPLVINRCFVYSKVH